MSCYEQLVLCGDMPKLTPINATKSQFAYTTLYALSKTKSELRLYQHKHVIKPAFAGHCKRLEHNMSMNPSNITGQQKTRLTVQKQCTTPR